MISLSLENEAIKNFIEFIEYYITHKLSKVILCVAYLFCIKVFTTDYIFLNKLNNRRMLVVLNIGE